MNHKPLKSETEQARDLEDAIKESIIEGTLDSIVHQDFVDNGQLPSIDDSNREVQDHNEHLSMSLDLVYDHRHK